MSARPKIASVKLADVDKNHGIRQNDGKNMKTKETAEKVDRPWKPQKPETDYGKHGNRKPP